MCFLCPLYIIYEYIGGEPKQFKIASVRTKSIIINSLFCHVYDKSEGLIAWDSNIKKEKKKLNQKNSVPKGDIGPTPRHHTSIERRWNLRTRGRQVDGVGRLTTLMSERGDGDRLKIKRKTSLSE